MTFLVDNPNRLRQYQYPRRGGGYTAPQITLHTYEAPHTRSLVAAATWLLQRTTYGSYHALVGHRSNTDVLQLAPWSYETYHSTPNNNWAIGISAVAYAHQWRSIPTRSANNIVDSMAYAAANAAQWLVRHHGRVVEPRLLTRAQAMRKESGFVHHRIMDPGRRTDPANPQSHFPWDRFINRFNALMAGDPTPSKPTTPERTWLDMNPDELNRHLSRHAENVHRSIRRDLPGDIIRATQSERAAAAGERAALLKAIEQIAGGQPIDLDAIAKAAHDGAEAGVTDALKALEADVTLTINTDQEG